MKESCLTFKVSEYVKRSKLLVLQEKWRNVSRCCSKLKNMEWGYLTYLFWKEIRSISYNLEAPVHLFPEFVQSNLLLIFVQILLLNLSNKFTSPSLHQPDQRSLDVRGTYYLDIFYSRFFTTVPHAWISFLFLPPKFISFLFCLPLYIYFLLVSLFSHGIWAGTLRHIQPIMSGLDLTF